MPVRPSQKQEAEAPKCGFCCPEGNKCRCPRAGADEGWSPAGVLLCGYWRAVVPLGWLSGVGLPRIDDSGTLQELIQPKAS